MRVMHCQLTSDYYVLTALYFHVPKPPPFGACGCLRKRNAIYRLQAVLTGREAGRKVSEGKKKMFYYCKEGLPSERWL